MVDRELFQRLVALRRDLHRHPELSWHETRTAEQVCRVLDRLGIEYRRGVAETGVVADLPGPPDVPAVALRADMDALPIEEETGLKYASVHVGVMHACGHDGHTSMLLGAAELLKRESTLPCPVRLLFQPAEETGSGARAMIEDGALDGVGMIFGGHLDAAYAPGEIVVDPTAVNASTDEFVIQLSGPGGHAARPHETVDPIVAGSLIVAALQTIVARSVQPNQVAVVTVGRFEAGTAANVIATQARLTGTLRALDAAVRTRLVTAVRQVAESTAAAQDVEVEVNFTEGTPAVVNAPEPTALARETAAIVVGDERVLPLRTPNLGGEDFGFFLQHVPGCYVRFGAQPSGETTFPAHSSRFGFDEQALAVGAGYFYQVALVAGRRLREA
jgi:hippurate hydrolase